MRLLAVLLLILIGGCSVNRGDLQTVESVDLNRYLGIWYQYAYVPSSFQPLEGALSTAEYSLLPNGKISVVNTNYEDWDGTRIRKVAKAKAWVVDPSNAKLKVSFFWPFTGNYWIIDLDSENYSYAVVGEPGLNYVWFLSRSPLMDPERYEQLKARVADQGYDISKVVETHR